ncbi:MAG: DUF1559 domain-containing protein [Planctomycetota bacterium]|nr:DUF1559 domain-containing protein [Planctomycetota bacterium]
MLVSMAVIAVLISILLPSFAKVNETARRVVCQSNIRQIGLGVLMYADDFRGYLPPSVFISDDPRQRGSDRPHEMVTVRLPTSEDPAAPWDGLGVLFQTGYVSAPKVFYCPSHFGDSPYSEYANLWNEGIGEIVCNYHYRGGGPARPSSGSQMTTKLFMIDPARSALIADGMRVRTDYNHRVGVNFFRADLTVHWFNDSNRALAEDLPEDKNDPEAPRAVDQAWTRFDRVSATGPG